MAEEKKPSIKEEASSWWEENKKVVKGIAITGAIAGLFGYCKGCMKSNQITSKALDNLSIKVAEKIPSAPITKDTPIEEILEGYTRKEIEEIMSDMVMDGRMCERWD